MIGIGFHYVGGEDEGAAADLFYAAVGMDDADYVESAARKDAGDEAA